MRRFLLTLALILPLSAPAWAELPKSFAIEGAHFVRDGKPHVIRSGEMHYPRVPREYWRDRFRKARAMGLNTIQTYVFWNLHEPEPGKFDFSSNLDIAEFVREAGEEGLDVIVRPGPYICTELDFGGFPAWLLRTQGMRVRSLDPRFMAASERYMQRVAQELKPLMVTRGGPIVMAQVENEYGSFGRDRDYMEAIKKQMIDAGFDVPLFTADGAGPFYFEGGPLPGVPAVINFGGGLQSAKESFAELKKFRPDGPRMVGEYWAGWFDHWGEKHNVTNAAGQARALDWMLANDISFSLYMWHGGTSFGWQPGANYSGEQPYQPDTTSYDYDGALDEAGRITPKYKLFREVIAKHLRKGEKLPPIPQSAPTIAVPSFALTETVNLLDALPALSTPQIHWRPKGMEELGQNYGFVLYRKRLDAAVKGKLDVSEVRDYAIVMADGKVLGKIDRRFGERGFDVDLPAGTVLDLLVENMGRINFGTKLVDETKGISRDISIGDEELNNWTMYPLPLSDLSALAFAKTGDGAPAKNSQPQFRRASFEVQQTGDTFLDTRQLGKGHVWINGHHLGRYWHIGPQQTLFVPGVWLKPGRNEVIVLEAETGSGATLQGLAEPVFSN
ncbi:MAG: beta-galactosidase [Pseudoxanthomonas sp.]